MSQDIVIVGAGLSGTLMAMTLARHSTFKGQIRLIGVDQRPGLGVAYSTRDPAHLLNAPAGKMSLFTDQPAHFVQWLQRQRTYAVSSPTETLERFFAPRSMYGAFIQEIWAEHLAAYPERLLYIKDEVLDIRRTTPFEHGAENIAKELGSLFEIYLRNNEPLHARSVILALGFNLPEPPQVPGFHLAATKQCYVHNPWDDSAQQLISPSDTVLLVGTGLTACDVMLSLLGRGHRGPIVVLSRHGLLPQAHSGDPLPPCPWSPKAQDLVGLTVSELTKILRQYCARAEKTGSDWRTVVDALRPHTPDIWQGLDTAEKRRFLRHLRPFWNTHRHRIPPKAMAEIRGAMERGQIHIKSGRLLNIREGQDRRLTVDVGSRGTVVATACDWIVNCTGPQTNPLKSPSPLVRALVQSQMLHPHPLGLGVTVDANCQITNHQNVPLPGFYTLGPL